MKDLVRYGLVVGLLAGLGVFHELSKASAATEPREASEAYRVLAPIESGNLLLFPVVRADGKTPGTTAFLTLDEGIKSGEVEVTEAGRVRGLVRHRGTIGVPPYNNGSDLDHPRTADITRDDDDAYRGDLVNTLVLVNHSEKPLLLLAGEIVTGGKQDRVIAKDRIVPAGGEPIDLGVFCIEPGRWTESSATFGASAKGSVHSFMVQPTVRQRAMVAKDQQQVWESVRGTIAQLDVAAAPAASAGYGAGSGTSSYAKTMQDSAVSEVVDEAAAPVMKSREQVLAKLRDEHAVGVVVAVRGEIVWADVFADSDLLARYWTKLVRSYAAESLTAGETHGKPTVEDAQHFLDAPTGGTETSEGEVGVYRYRELHSAGTETFLLESLLPGTGYGVHLSKLKLRMAEHHPKPVYLRPEIYR